MQYGHFDDANREYVITESKTPMPWANYLGSPAYGAIISNNAGGYSFRQSGANGGADAGVADTGALLLTFVFTAGSGA